MGEQTDEILAQVMDGTSTEDNVDFVDGAEVLLELRSDIEHKSSLSKFANECGIQPSHLSDFFNKGKKLGRDKLLAAFISLEYDLEKTQAMLRRLGLSELYVRSRRDYQIAVCIREGKSLDETDEVLCSKGMEPLAVRAELNPASPKEQRGSSKS